MPRPAPQVPLLCLEQVLEKAAVSGELFAQVVLEADDAMLHIPYLNIPRYDPGPAKKSKTQVYSVSLAKKRFVYKSKMYPL
jgi:hypothetical protein